MPGDAAGPLAAGLALRETLATPPGQGALLVRLRARNKSNERAVAELKANEVSSRYAVYFGTRPTRGSSQRHAQPSAAAWLYAVKLHTQEGSQYAYTYS